MKHQVTLLGGQIEPIYWGVLEFTPNILHVIYTKESQSNLKLLKKVINVSKIYSYQVDPNDFISTLEVVQGIFGAHKNSNFSLNLTGGTKIMALASLSAFQDMKLGYFYIDQNLNILQMPSLEQSMLTASSSLSKILKLTGVDKVNYSTPSKLFGLPDIRLAEFINQNLSRKGFRSLITQIGNLHRKKAFNGYCSINKNSIRISNDIEIQINDDVVTFAKTSISLDTIAKGFWWEILIAHSLRQTKSLVKVMNVEFISNSNENVLNEIDIMLFDNRTLHFIEAKSGNVTQDQVNKLQTVRKLYGSQLSHSFLICRYSPRPDILEKCNSLNIHVLVNSQNLTGKKYSSFKEISQIQNIVSSKLRQKRI